MKRIILILSFLSLIAVSWHFAWQQTFNKLEYYLASNAQQINERNANADIKISYNVTPYGYPFKAGISINDISILWKNIATDDKFTVNFTGENYVYVTFTDIVKLLWQNDINYRTESSDLEGFFEAQGEGGNVSIVVHIARSVGEGVLANDTYYKGIASDIDFYVSTKEIAEQRLITINSFAINSNKSVKNNLLSARYNSDIIGATIFNIGNEDSYTIDKLQFITSLNNMPRAQQLTDAIYELSQSKEGDMMNLKLLKLGLKEQIKELAKHNSSINFEKYSIAMGDFKANLNGYITVDDMYKAQGKLTLILKDIATLTNNDSLSKAIPLIGVIPDNGKPMEFTVQAKDSMLLFNGIPMFELPSLLALVDNLPDEFSRNNNDSEDLQLEKLPDIRDVTKTVVEPINTIPKMGI